MANVTQAQWAQYKAIINGVQDSFNQQTIVWKPLQNNLQRYGEDGPDDMGYGTINLKCLIDYNAFRKWPINQGTESGVIDKESIAVIFNIKYLRDLGYTDSNNNFIFNPDDDYFIIDGLRYRSAGDIKVAQASDEALLLQIIMRRDTTKTSESKY